MHEVVMEFVKAAKIRHPELFSQKRVIEYGSTNINGSVREFFINCDYVGVDWMKNPGVDVVSLMHDYKSEPVDVVISTSTAEHDPYWIKSLRKCVELLKPGGSIIFTCAGPNYEKHCLATAPIRDDVAHYYRGIPSGEIKDLIGENFKEVVDLSNLIDILLFFKEKI